MTAIKINLAKIPPVAKTLMINRGAPKHAMRFGISLDEKIILPVTHFKRRLIPATVQLAQYRRSWENPTGSWLMVIGTYGDEDMALVAALGLMLKATIKNAENPSIYNRPFFWRLFGGNYDKLRQNDEFRNGIGNIGILILNNLAENSTVEKIEKARDLCSLYSDIPKVIVVAGTDPMVFSLEKLHLTPQRVLHLGRKGKEIRI